MEKVNGKLSIYDTIINKKKYNVNVTVYCNLNTTTNTIQLQVKTISYSLTAQNKCLHITDEGPTLFSCFRNP